MAKARKDFLDILVAKGKLSPGQTDEIRTVAKSRGIKLNDAVVQLGYASAKDVCAALAEEFKIEFIDLENTEIPQSMVDLIPESIARENVILPLANEGGKIKFIGSDPSDLDALEKLRFVLNSEVEMVLAPRESIVQVINQLYGQTEAQSVDSLLTDFTSTQIESTQIEDAGMSLDADSDAPVVKLVNLIFSEAVTQRASDIHIEPFDDRVRIRYRIDGNLVERDNVPKRMLGALLTRLKILGSIDITEKRRPQDGRIKLSNIANKELDVRVSVLPTNHGQSVVMRLLDKDNIKVKIPDLGFYEQDFEKFTRIIRRPNGIFLVTGPTGSGKTTTLYAALNELNTPNRKIITAEDPVEYYLSGINQCEVRADIGMTFQSIIRAMLRQAPNIILVGEIRDKETADIAIQASLTGHLVFSTLHTNDAPSSITRLIDIGVQPFLVAASLLAVLAQRLVRTICPKCKQPYQPSVEELAQIGLSPEKAEKGQFARGAGCGNCHRTGYRGRRGIFELMPMSGALRELTFKQESHLELRKAARAGGMRTLFDDGIYKAFKGITTIEEVVSVAGSEGH